MEKPNLVLLVDDDEISNFINETILKGNLKNTEIHSFIDPHEDRKSTRLNSSH